MSNGREVSDSDIGSRGRSGILVDRVLEAISHLTSIDHELSVV